MRQDGSFLAKLAPGTIDCFKVSCWWCDTVEHFSPPHSQVHRARVHARVLGWFFWSPKGWQCPACKKRRKATELSRIQTTLPGFGVLSRNQGGRFGGEDA